VTGNALPGQSAGTNDVDDGQTTLVSPVFDMEGYDIATVSYWVWYTNAYGGAPGTDIWRVMVTNNGVTWVDLENTTVSTNAWVERSFDLDSHIALTDQVRFRFVAADTGSPSLVEAAIDDFNLTAMSSTTGIGPGTGSPVLVSGLDPCRPNPFNPATTITFRVATSGQAMLRIYDVSGRRVATLVDGSVTAGEHSLRWDGRNDAGRTVASGIYFMRLDAPGFMQVRQMTLIR
jgi:hypothetical protein